MSDTEQQTKTQTIISRINKNINVYNIILKHSDFGSSPYMFACGAIQGLEALLKEILELDK